MRSGSPTTWANMLAGSFAAAIWYAIWRFRHAAYCAWRIDFYADRAHRGPQPEGTSPMNGVCSKPEQSQADYASKNDERHCIDLSAAHGGIFMQLYEAHPGMCR
jgi:hypothetical protein